jgi:glycosyltransferase involved in cell wall biosynthesis
MKKLLILTTRFPYPVVGGDRLRIYQICKALSHHHQLTLLSLCETKVEQEMDLPDDGVFSTVERIYMPRWHSWMNCLAALPGRIPLQVAYYQNAKFRRRAKALMNQHDGCLSHLIRAGDAVKDLQGVKFLEMTDAISMNYERIRKTGYAKNDWRSHIFSLESRRLRQYEMSITDYFNHSFLVSAIDRDFLFSKKEKKISKVSVCSNGVDLDGIPYQFTTSGQDIIFIGNMHSLQNLDAANFMATEVFPLIRKLHPHSSLRLIGRIHYVDALRLEKFEGVKATGEVPDVVSAARGGGVGICPLRLGAGVQNKVLEYMALGLPTVTTSLGLEGFSAQDGKELLVADDAQGLANAVIKLLDNRAMAKSMAEAARLYVESAHTWQAQLAPLLDTISESLSGATRK